MSIRDKIRKAVAQAVEGFDFTDIIEEAVNDIDINGIVFTCLYEKVSRIDISKAVEKTIHEIVEEELDELDLEELLTDELFDL